MIERLTDEQLTEARRAAMRSGRWPRSERRQARITEVLSARQPDLTLVLEDVHDPHNVSAVLRTADATGVLGVHTVYNVDAPPDDAYAATTSASAAKWVEVTRHASIGECYRALREAGLLIAATALHPAAMPLYAVDLTQPVALVLGNEMRGVSPAAREGADIVIEIPMRGMVQSLNVSVAASVALYEALRQRDAAGMYASPRLSPELMAEMTTEWLSR